MTSESKGDDEGTPAHGSSSGTCTHLESNRVKLKKWAAVALWSYDIGGSRKRIIFFKFFFAHRPHLRVCSKPFVWVFFVLRRQRRKLCDLFEHSLGPM
jgi:hypothetical protein